MGPGGRGSPPKAPAPGGGAGWREPCLCHDRRLLTGFTAAQLSDYTSGYKTVTSGSCHPTQLMESRRNTCHLFPSHWEEETSVLQKLSPVDT